MTTQEQIESTITLTCNENAIAISEVEVGIIALDLLKSGLIAFGNQKTVADIEQGDTFKWGEKEYIKLDSTSVGCLCLAKDIWFYSDFDDEINNWEQSDLRGGITIKTQEYIPDIYKLVLFDRDLITDDGLTGYGYCTDYISMLTCDEYRKYRKYIPTLDWWCWTITALTTKNDRFVRNANPDDQYNFTSIDFAIDEWQDEGSELRVIGNIHDNKED